MCLRKTCVPLLFTIFLLIRQYTCHSNEICISRAAWKVPICFLMREFKLCVYKFTARARRRTRCRGSPLTVKTISCLWKLEWLAKCSTKVWKFPGSDQHSRHVWTIFWRFSNILLQFSHVSVLFLLGKVQIRFTWQEDLYVTHGKMCTVFTWANSCTTW